MSDLQSPSFDLIQQINNISFLFDKYKTDEININARKIFGPLLFEIDISRELENGKTMSDIISENNLNQTMSELISNFSDKEEFAGHILIFLLFMLIHLFRNEDPNIYEQITNKFEITLENNIISNIKIKKDNFI